MSLELLKKLGAGKRRKAQQKRVLGCRRTQEHVTSTNQFLKGQRKFTVSAVREGHREWSVTV